MSWIDRIKELKRLEAQVDLEKSDVFDIDLGYISIIIHAAPMLLDVLGEIQPDDTRKLDRIRSILLGWQETHPRTEIEFELRLIDRYRSMAERMETKECQE